MDDAVITTVEDRATQKQYTVKSRHVVACDGAKSAVRRFLGVTSEGEETCRYFFNTWISRLKGLHIMIRRDNDDDSFQCGSQANNQRPRWDAPLGDGSAGLWVYYWLRSIGKSSAHLQFRCECRKFILCSFPLIRTWEARETSRRVLE